VRDVIVLGGYGRVGALVAREIFETTRTRVVVAGRSVQRAEELAARHGENARAAYADARDPRTLRSLLDGAAAVVACCGADGLAALDAALELRIPYVGVSTLALDSRSSERLTERAWEAQVPLVVHAGAVPGLAGVASEWLVRRLPEIDTLRVVTTGPWLGSETARRDVRDRDQRGRTLEYRDGSWGSAHVRSLRWRFPGQQGVRTLRPARTPELERFPESHCVDNLVYLEPDAGLLERGLEWAIGLPRPSQFSLEAEAFTAADPERPALRLEITASDAPTAAAVVAVAVLRRILAGRAPPGLLTPADALNPALMLEALEKRGISIRERGPGTRSASAGQPA
jgi:hypothetical protein